MSGFVRFSISNISTRLFGRSFLVADKVIKTVRIAAATSKGDVRIADKLQIVIFNKTVSGHEFRYRHTNCGR